MSIKARIEQDTDATSPAEYDNNGLFLIAKHRQCFIPPSPKERHFDVGAVIEQHRETHHVFLLEAYIHSGVVLALAGEGNFPDRQWDVSTLGAVFASKEEWSTKEQARAAALCKVEEWNQYLSGDVWGYVIETEEGQHLDSCWGFYGRKYAEQEAQQALEYAQKNSDCAACLI